MRRTVKGYYHDLWNIENPKSDPHFLFFSERESHFFEHDDLIAINEIGYVSMADFGAESMIFARIHRRSMWIFDPPAWLSSAALRRPSKTMTFPAPVTEQRFSGAKATDT